MTGSCPLDHTELRRDEDGALVCSHGHEYEELQDTPPLRTCSRCVTHAELEDGPSDRLVICNGAPPAPYGQPVPRAWFCASGVWSAS